MTYTNIVMLCKGKNVVYCGNLTKHINAVSQNARYFNIRRDVRYGKHFALNVMILHHADLTYQISLRSLCTFHYKEIKYKYTSLSFRYGSCSVNDYNTYSEAIFPPADARPSTTETTWEVEFIAPGISMYIEMD